MNQKSQKSVKSELESNLPANEDLDPIKQNQMDIKGNHQSGSCDNNTFKNIMKG